MSKVAQVEEIEEIDSPTFSAPAPPPSFPRSESHQSSSADKRPPALPSRRPKMMAPSGGDKKSNVRYNPKTSDSKQLTIDIGDNQELGIENPAFTTDVKLKGHISSGSSARIEYGEDNGIYETYDHSLYTNGTMTSDMLQSDTNDARATDIEQPSSYEVPVTSRNEKANSDKDFISRQSSSSGLPEVVFNLMEKNDADQDIYDNDEVDIKDTGLPFNSDPLDMNDAVIYEDVETSENDESQSPMISSTSDTIDDKFKDSAQSEPKIPPLGFDTLAVNTSPVYDTGYIASTIEGDTDSERRLYEDPEVDIAPNDSDNFTVNDKTSENKDENTITDKSVGDGFPTKNTIPVPVVDKQPESEAILTPPEVPPRRDLISQMSVSPPTGFKPIAEVNNGEKEEEGIATPAQTVITDVEIRSGTRLSDMNNKLSVENSYFVDLDDGSKEISETEQKRISVYKMGDNEMSLNELLHLYTTDNTHTVDNVEVINGITNSEAQSEMAEDDVVINNISNEFIKTGNISGAEEVYNDENLYDVPPPAYWEESLA